MRKVRTILILLLAGCLSISCTKERALYLEGPRVITGEAQHLEYTQEEGDVNLYILYIITNYYDHLGNLMCSELYEREDGILDDGVFNCSVFKGGTLRFDVRANNTEYVREFNIYYRDWWSTIGPLCLTITQYAI